MKNKNETDDITVSIEDQHDIAYQNLTDATLIRLYDLRIPPFTKKYLM
jgi:hypothetical protein